MRAGNGRKVASSIDVSGAASGPLRARKTNVLGGGGFGRHGKQTRPVFREHRRDTVVVTLSLEHHFFENFGHEQLLQRLILRHDSKSYRVEFLGPQSPAQSP